MKIIDLLNKKADKSLKDNFRFVYENRVFIFNKKTDKILRPYTRILNGHNTEYCDKSQTNIKDEFLDTLYDLIKANLVEKVEG